MLNFNSSGRNTCWSESVSFANLHSSSAVWATTECCLSCRPRVKGRFVKQSDFDDLHLEDVKEEDAEGHAPLREFQEDGSDISRQHSHGRAGPHFGF